MKKETVLVFCAHSDDQILGVGGTMAKYSKEGKRVICVVFSTGQGSHPWLQEKFLFDIRKEESLVAGHVIGAEDTIFLALRDGKLKEDCKEPATIKRLVAMIKRFSPSKIFTHDADDSHPDHRAVHYATLQAVDAIKKHIEVYTYNIWFMNFRKRRTPKLVVDISSTFAIKKKALTAFGSQKLSIYQLTPFVYAKAFFNGLDADCKYAETFYKIR